MATTIDTINVGGVDKKIEDAYARERLDEIISSPAPSAAEVADARVGYDEVNYGALGTAIRSQFAKTVFNKGITFNVLESCDDADTNSIYFVSSDGSIMEPSDFPIGESGWLVTYVLPSTRIQFAYPYSNTKDIQIRRKTVTGQWTEWTRISVRDYNKALIALNENSVCGNVLHEIKPVKPTNVGTSQVTVFYDYNKGMYKLQGSASVEASKNIAYTNGNDLHGLIPGKTYNMVVRLEDIVSCPDDFIIQVYVNKDSSAANWVPLRYVAIGTIAKVTIPSDAKGILVRLYCTVGSYNVYAALECVEEHLYTPYMTALSIKHDLFRNYISVEGTNLSCDDLNESGVYFNSSDGGISTFADFPFNSPGWLFNYPTLNNLKVQMAVSYEDSSMKVRIHKLNGWSSWVGLGSGVTYNVTQEINRDNITNTYNITTSPTITTDSNGWLQAVDDENTEEANATDMSGAIMSMLNSTGYCHLGPGVFYVSGNIDMPNGSMLEGCGEKTVIRLLSSVSSGYIVRIINKNTIRNIKFSGGKNIPANIFDSDSTGSKHGVYCIGNADGQESTQPTVVNNMVNGCWFEYFDGSGFYAHNSGGGVNQGVIMTSCYFAYCRVGINIDYFFEYAKFTDCVITSCHYACINNGGNNVFSSTTFHGVVGMLVDNSAGDKQNDTHGSVVGCTFNHIDNMHQQGGNGLAVHIIGGRCGEVFSGCQFWYGNVEINNSVGVTFVGNYFGNNAISIKVTGSHPAFFHNNTFHNQPTLDVNSGTVFTNNYTKAGAVVAA